MIFCQNWLKLVKKLIWDYGEIETYFYVSFGGSCPHFDFVYGII